MSTSTAPASQTPASQTPAYQTQTTQNPAAGPAVARRSVPRATAAAFGTAGLVLTTTAIALAVRHDTGVAPVLVFAVLPDLALLLAIGRQFRHGQLPRRAVPAYNLLHHPVLPALLLVAAAAGLGTWWLVASLAWGAHITFDRAAGYGLRTADGWQRA
jgi:hypothetical protein